MRTTATSIAAMAAVCLSAQWVSAHDGDMAPPSDAARSRLGTVHFVTSCAPSVTKDFDVAMALLHSFWTKEAIKGFNGVLTRDPDCAIAYWGIAIALQQNPLTGMEPSAKATQDALAGLEKAKTIGAKTQRERDYLAAIELIYKDADKIDFRSRRLAYEKAMEEQARRYPDDAEASIFYALSLDMTAQLSDQTYANQLKAAALLEPLLIQQPEHPGIAHYLIHSYDYPAIAASGVPAARIYSRIAPDNPHALHMPSHIFTRLGMWQNSIDANLRSAAAARAESNGQEQAHAEDYLEYAYLQLGQDVQAKRVVAESAFIVINPAVFVGPYGLAATPARYALERRAWTEASALPVHSTKFFFPEAITHFVRGLGSVHTGDIESAQKEAAQLGALRDALSEKKNTYWMNQVEVQRLALDAWIALARQQQADALARMRASADLEDSMEKHIVTPGAVVPARELLGEMLLEVKQPAEALKAFEASAKREPNRFHGVYGAAQAAARSGDADKAKTYYANFLILAAHADSTRTEMIQAKAYLAQR